jgi:hypothetical protein
MNTPNFLVRSITVKHKDQKVIFENGKQKISLSFDQIRSNSTFRTSLYKLDSLPFQISWVIRVFGNVVFEANGCDQPFEITTRQTRKILKEVYSSSVV